MINTETKEYCAGIVQEHYPDTFLASLFIPEASRPYFMAVYALDAELDKVRDSVSEEILAHIRYVWWDEAIEALYKNEGARGHPVLNALEPVIGQGWLSEMVLFPLMECYRRHYPEFPPERGRNLDVITKSMIRILCPAAEQGWESGMRVIERHRRTYGGRFNGWLHLKLLVRGLV